MAVKASLREAPQDDAMFLVPSTKGLFIPGRGLCPRARNPWTQASQIKALAGVRRVPGPALAGRPGITIKARDAQHSFPAFAPLRLQVGA